jgi:ribosomal-protein-alanine N-acetyltransferase
LVFKETDKLIGTAGLYRYDEQNLSILMGADLSKEYWGKGLMTEALKALVQYCFEIMKINRIEVTTDPKNIRAINLIKRLGFTKEGLLRQKYFYKGQFHDDIIFSLLKREWMEI